MSMNQETGGRIPTAPSEVVQNGRIEGLQKHGTQKFFSAMTADRRVNKARQTPAPVERALVHDLPDCTQRMITTNTILQIDIAE